MNQLRDKLLVMTAEIEKGNGLFAGLFIEEFMSHVEAGALLDYSEDQMKGVEDVGKRDCGFTHTPIARTPTHAYIQACTPIHTHPRTHSPIHMDMYKCMHASTHPYTHI